MPWDFTGQVALVTGGGNGIGAAVCRAFAAAGARVAVIDRDAAAGEAVAAEIGNAASAHALDVADADAFAKLVDAVVAKEGGIDVLVNAAGTISRQTIAKMPTEDWDRILAVNLRGPFNGVQAVIPHKSPRWWRNRKYRLGGRKTYLVRRRRQLYRIKGGIDRIHPPCRL